MYNQSRDHFGVILRCIIKNDTFDCVIMRMESEGERICRSCPFVMFVVLPVDQCKLFGAMMAPAL